MGRHKGIPSDGTLDRGWPYHAVVPWENCCGPRYEPAHGWALARGCCDRTVHIDRWGVANHIVFRFKDPETAEEMCHLFGGETYDANDKSKGSGWEKWRKKPPMKKAS